MSATLRDLMQLAVELCRSPLAARKRAALSRAYYALFHGAIELLRAAGIHVSKGPGGHGEVRKPFLASDDHVLEAIGSRLNRLHTLRIAADYRLSVEYVEEGKLVVDAVSEAGKLLSELEACTSNPVAVRSSKP